VADASQLISGVAERYASSLFELALEAGAIDAVAADLNRFQAMIDESDDLKRLVQSPVFTAEDQVKAISAIGEKAGFSALVLNFLKVVASNRRLFAVTGMAAAYRQIVARHKGEMTADVTSAHALTGRAGNRTESGAEGRYRQGSLDLRHGRSLPARRPDRQGRLPPDRHVSSHQTFHP
jgi:F-type H+-transporting ATPase subunit delta